MQKLKQSLKPNHTLLDPRNVLLFALFVGLGVVILAVAIATSDNLKLINDLELDIQTQEHLLLEHKHTIEDLERTMFYLEHRLMIQEDNMHISIEMLDQIERSLNYGRLPTPAN